MKNTPLQSIIDDSLDRMFFVDKRGKMVFFPWGGKKQGYLLRSRSLVAKVKKFYRSSLFTCFFIFVVAAALFHNNFWGIIGSIFISFGIWFLAYYLYASRIVKSLPVVKRSYSEVVLEKLELEDEEESSQTQIQFHAHWNRPVPQRKWNLFAQIQHVWYRLSPGQVFMICFFMSLFTGLVWSMYRPQQWVEADYLVGFFACVLLGYGGFIVIQHLETTKVGWFEFKQLKLSMVLTMVGSWIFAAWFLYKFVVLLVTPE